MKLLKGVGDFFALDIGTNAIRVIQLSKAGSTWNLDHFGYVPIDSRVSMADSEDARRKLGELIMTAVGQSGITTKNVVIGLPSQKTFTTVIDVPAMSESELKSTIKYQIDQYIPMSVDDAKVDWVLLGQSLHDPKKQEVMIASTSNSYAEERLEFIESLGFNVIGAEPDAIAMIRSVLPVGTQDARLVINMGDHSSDIVMTFGETPRLVRMVPTGLQSLVKIAVQNLNIQDEQARQFILKFGLAPDRLEGQVLRALEGTLDGFIAELSKSIKFFQTRYPSVPLGGVLLSGYTAVVPHFGEYINAKLAVSSSLAGPWHRVNVSQAYQQQLAPISQEFATAVGLAQRTNK